MDWFQQALIKKAQMEAKGLNYSYSQIARDFGKHYDTVRKKFKEYYKSESDSIIEPATGGFVTTGVNEDKFKTTGINVTPVINLNTDFVVPKKIVEQIREKVGFSFPSVTNEDTSLKDKIKDALHKECYIPTLAEENNVSIGVIKAVIEDIRAEGINIFEAGDYAKISKVAVATEETYDWDWNGNQIIRFGIVSDPHLCSKWQQLTHLNTIYDIFEKEKITRVLNIGDLTEGVNMRKGHEYDLFVYGVDEQADYVIDKYPKRDGIITEFITGNHDHSGIKNAGADIGRRIANERKDMKYLGLSNARINITPNCTIELNHGLDGASYALSYTLQKFIDALDNSDLPDIFLNGHHHKLMYTYYRNIHAMECGTFQAQTPWMKGKRIAAHVGGIILTVHVDGNGVVKRFVPEFIPFYKFKNKDW